MVANTLANLAVGTFVAGVIAPIFTVAQMRELDTSVYANLQFAGIIAMMLVFGFSLASWLIMGWIDAPEEQGEDS